MLEPILLTKPGENGRKKSNGNSFDTENEELMDITTTTTTTTTTPRSVIIIPRSKSQAARRRVTPSSFSISESNNDGYSIVEKHLPNGDLYIGKFSNNTPHGSGKYVWKDGCMYEGEWKKGKVNGRGKFSWPSGATFDGDFRLGRMEGNGTFVGSDGDMYKGSWSGDRKHGYGVKHYSNGDYYEGQWKKNLQDGHGRYLWRNGNEYNGEWKNGVMNGRGVLVWNNGNTYEGNWKNGVPNGQGNFTWSKGSCYAGRWSNDSSSCKYGNADKKHKLNGTFRPGNNVVNGKSGLEDGLEGYFSHKLGEESEDVMIDFGGDRNRRPSSVEGGIVERPVPHLCIWDSDGEEGDITCDIIQNVEASMLYRNSSCFSDELKKPGQTISKGHKNYDLMLNLQLGIRYSVGKLASILRDLKLSDFDPLEKFWTRFPPQGSKITPPHQSMEFRWKDYCPVVFRHLREVFQVDPADYMLAICGNESLRELPSPGKSGSLFYLTQDDRFMIKTVKKSELKVLIKMLPSYYKHVCRYENSLLTKFYGVHCVKPVGGVKTRFIVMGNLFCSEYQIHRRFDLKGSSHGRTTDKFEDEIDETTTLKDLDLNFVFRLQTNWYQELIKQIYRDCEFLEAERIMDYSLLVGVHFRDVSAAEKIGLSPFVLHTGNNDSYQNEKFMRGYRFLEAELQDMDMILAGRKRRIRLGASMPARAEKMARRSDFDQYTCSNLAPSRSGEIYETVLYFGIIDILQGYDISKKIEHAYKSLQVDSTSISAVDPKLYSKRFRDFIGRIFIEDR